MQLEQPAVHLSEPRWLRAGHPHRAAATQKAAGPGKAENQAQGLSGQRGIHPRRGGRDQGNFQLGRKLQTALFRQEITQQLKQAQSPRLNDHKYVADAAQSTNDNGVARLRQ